ncbi:MAG: hypothetical protein AAF623_18025, partial [Planctomycetota bacterium]
MSSTFAQGCSLKQELQSAIIESSHLVIEKIGGAPDLVFAFLAGYSPEAIDQFGGLIQKQTNAQKVVGCSCQTTTSGGREYEDQTAVSLLACKFTNCCQNSGHFDFIPNSDQPIFTGWGPDYASWNSGSTLIKTQTKDYCRNSQIRLILRPIAEQLVGALGH